MPDENAQVTNIRKRLGLETHPAILGDTATPANIWDNTKPGNVWIRYLTGNGYSTPVSVRGPAGKSVKLNAGAKVTIGYDDDMQLSVIGIDFAGAVASGINPVVSNNGAQPTNNGFVGQDQISTLVCHSTNSLSIAVRGWKPIVGGTMYDFPGSSIDLTSYIPASTDNHRVIVIFLKSDYITLEAFGSTDKDQGIPLDIADINEALALATAGSTPVWAYRLYYGQTSVLDSDTFLDCRQLVNVGSSGGGGSISVTDGVTTVNPATSVNFTSGATVSDGGGGVANVSVTGSGASPLTTKGDLFTHSTVDARLPVGPDGQILTADSAQATGLKWAAGGANTALSNLASVAVNASILPASDLGVNLGSSAKRWQSIWGQSILADNNAFPVLNTSGATATAGDCGYLIYDGTSGYVYKTTTTANYDGSWCVVVIGGANNATIYVAVRGTVTVTLNANCAIGNYLTTSTTAGQAAVNTLMRPEVFAVALSANVGGAGGTCTAQLLTLSQDFALVSSEYLYACAGSSSTAFVSTINGAPSATSVVYGAVSSGAANSIVPFTSTALFKARLHNTTRGTYRLITSVNTGTSTITTPSTADAWANGDTITIESRTVTTGLTVKAVDIDGAAQSTLPTLVRGVWLLCGVSDSSSVSAVDLHPFETYAVSKLQQYNSQTTNRFNFVLSYTKLVSGVFTYFQQASGSGTSTATLSLQGYRLATP